jgi:biopolymer transport protein TolR
MDARQKKRKAILHSHDATKPANAEAVSEINITPLIDVMLVLLIIFMVVTPLAQKGLDIALPQTNADQPKPEQKQQDNQVVLTLDETGMTVNKSAVSNNEELDARLKEIFQTKSDKTIFVKAAGKVPYGKVVEAMDIARGAGVEKIGIISEKMLEDAGIAPPGAPPAAPPAGTN